MVRKLLALAVLVTASRAGADTSVRVTPRDSVLCSFVTNHCVTSAPCQRQSVTVYTSGKLTYRWSEQFSEETQVVERRLDGRQLARLIAAFQRARFFSLRGDYTRPPKGEDEASADDISTAFVISFRHGGRAKTVSYDEEPSYSTDRMITNAPKRLLELRDAIADIVDLERLSKDE
jgi:hypothetical protein